MNIFEYQHIDRVFVWSDTDWAGCKVTRKSTSGGMVCLGKHILKSYSTTQTVIARSPTEAADYGITKGASVGIGIQGMFADFGIKLKLEVFTDASAALIISKRIGLGKIRHLETSQLWMQGKVANGLVIITKVDGKVNKADALTKCLAGPQLSEHVAWYQCVGRTRSILV